MFIRDDRTYECIKTKGIPFFGNASKAVSLLHIYTKYTVISVMFEVESKPHDPLFMKNFNKYISFFGPNKDALFR
jgi:hypothetical protein